MQHSHINNKRINDIICNWCHVIWFSPEMVLLPMVAFPLKAIITIIYSNIDTGMYRICEITQEA